MICFGVDLCAVVKGEGCFVSGVFPFVITCMEHSPSQSL